MIHTGLPTKNETVKTTGNDDLRFKFSVLPEM